MPALATRSRPASRRCGLLARAAACLVLAATAEAAPLDWQVDITPGGELFPVLDLSQAPRERSAPGGGTGTLAVRVKAPRAGALHLRVETDGLRAPSEVEIDVREPGEIELRPRLDWDRAALERLSAPRRQTLRLRLEAPGSAPEERAVAVRVHPLDDALYYVREGRERVDLGWVFAAYVDPNDPVVDDILAIARASGADVERKAATPAERLEQVRAVWRALEAHGLRYAAGDPALSRGPSIFSQRVRLLGETWASRRANCIDSSVLIASVLERLGIASYIVLVPGHAFVGFATGAGREHAEFLEATLLDGRSRDSAASGFEAARAAGRKQWTRTAPRLDPRHRPDYALIDIGTARAYGIIPLAASSADTGSAATAEPSHGSR